jgi:hypothetical protein
MVQIGCPCNRHFGLRYRGSTGNNAWVGAGSFFLKGSPDLAAGPGYQPKRQTKFWVMGKKSKTGKTGTFARSLESSWPLAFDTSKLPERASRFVIADTRFSETSHGKPVCEPILGTGGPVSGHFRCTSCVC